ncbi:MAG: arginyl aminopeptidase [Flavobacteriales bacterium]|nr:arginyl aminopeptidase [Flavobacteriales bacterium]
MNQIILIICSLICFNLSSQNKFFAKNIIDTLTSDNYAGRGYAKDGHEKAANFIASKFKKLGLKGFDSDYKQEFQINVNCFNGDADLIIDNKIMYAGVDFIVDPRCPGVKGNFDLVWLNPKIIGNAKKMIAFSSQDLKNSFLIIDKTGIIDSTQLEFLNTMIHNPFQAKGIVFVQDEKFTWGISQSQHSYPIIYIQKNRISFNNKKIELNIEATFEKDLITQNVLGYVKGSVQPDSFLVLSAHYDHIGILGPDAIFTGANDNASGTSMLLDLARHYSLPENHPRHSILFIAFGAEELGLLGSKFYVKKPYFPLSRINLQINIDIMGTGDDGLAMVNATENPETYQKFSMINKDKGYLTKIKKRGRAANSDHHPFDKKGVKAIFLYTMGGSKAYHDIYDTAENLTLSKYNEVFQLITDFITEYR